MRSFSTVLVMSLFVGVAPSWSRAAGPLIPDKMLEAAVREDLKKGEKEELKEDDLKNLYFLNGKGKKIASLAGLEQCVNLASIDRAENAIQALKPLKPLINVQSLVLSRNKI